MKYTLTRILAAFTLCFLPANLGRTQVVLPPSSDYNNAENYYHDCVGNNGEQHSGLCEQQTNLLFPEDKEDYRDEVATSEPSVEPERDSLQPYEASLGD
ncbi:MAG: hypothetical protein EB078_10865 [Proteobacteria bacterium]|nr:hypothetical protein [Pseudomonadota bacterium]NDC25604.1 hypothetical protein [Pseudomonadota bacterium]NDD05398.1 hypothetical protein [Pseudomonadota bacterium]NDG27139.1 hypothetical protein [Pseudomonadota bacterium]